MTKLEFLSPDLWQRLDGLATGLTPDQAIWVSGYFAGLGLATRPSAAGGAAAVEAPQRPSVSRTLTVLYASETGNSRGLASSLAAAAEAQGIAAQISEMGDYKVRRLKEEQDLLVITSTHGEGDPPQAGVGFFEYLEGRKAPQLPGIRFAVLALGDSTYERYCEAGRRIDRRLEALGAERIAERVDCDVDFDDAAAAWIETVLAKLAPAAQPPVPAYAAAAAPVDASTVFDRKNPFAAPVIENIVLTGRGSSKETRHIELSLAGSGLSYRPGDTLGIVAENDPALVAALLDRLALPSDASVSLKGRQTTLGDALARGFEITAATPRFLEHWAKLSDAAELAALCAPDCSEARMAFLRGHHVIDIVERFPVAGLDADTILAGLRPLQPRLYSIASSLEAAPEEAHLTVSTVRYALDGRERTGVASGHLAGLGEEATLPVYVQPSAHFHLPDDEVPIIMIGAGTGVAPYRAFMQEREARGAGGRSWLFFGERNFRSDFLYQVEWQDLLASRALTRMDVAFSRDGAEKVYVQDRLRRAGRDIYAWLEEGASVYVCGDATGMAPDVQASLIDIVAEHGGLGRDAAGDYMAGLQRNRRYLLDVY
ncbi:MAG TPA: assimilatory sulfite reductase (NADPH) flavoprotein subunit [Amaricoccus sp.]|nr:assimilatory sulfite reductase (NADPH) flavoprotein subunit [Amaricoccus sp.]